MVDEIKDKKISVQLGNEIRSGKYVIRTLPGDMRFVWRFGVGRKVAQHATLELQYRVVPEGFAVVGFEEIDSARLSVPSLTTAWSSFRSNQLYNGG